ncbi:Tim44 domain-containing protein [Legionella fallonii]|uniref:Putative hypothtical protein n=1 Tax=Legionella fallonii LLAP-10 TaxID=1212491 RepID=A0A098G7F0_9GAMM|nr:Tim44-like domain-containing protein [Legionella fallonii]CEG57931.1 putative hypothtical protein [Legionella fallonii LLAP-10]
MRNLFTCLLITLLSFGLVVNEAAAKRFGGGRSFGVQRSQSSLMSSHKPQQSTAALGQKSPASKWGGMLGGLLVGGLLASLFMGHGVASGIISWLILGAVVFFIVGFFRRRMQPSMQGAGSNAFGQSFSNFTQQFTNNNPGGSSSNSSASDYPADFDQENFLRDAKVCFIRLQTAYDQKNLQDLTTFTAPEVFGEIKMQLDERGDSPNKTEVITLNAELLDVSKQVDSSIASVRFTGTIKENDDPITQLNEIWHFRRFGNSKDWVVGGIQQEINPL